MMQAQKNSSLMKSENNKQNRTLVTREKMPRKQRKRQSPKKIMHKIRELRERNSITS
ncbi:hypothetical protein LguiA_029558 [Lonicera macranthoides]